MEENNITPETVRAKTAESISDKILGEERHVKPQNFPIWAMPKDTQKLIEEASSIYGLPSEIFAIHVLTAIAIAIGTKIVFKRKNCENYPQI